MILNRKDYVNFEIDPVIHIEEIQGVKTLEAYQKEIAYAIADNERVSIAACHDIGKTFLMAKIVLWFTSTFHDSKVITTAPTFNQVKRLLWSEIRAGYESSRIPLGGKMLQTEWQITADWFAMGFTSRPEAGFSLGQGTASSFQGFHAPYILVIFDEATGVPNSIWQQAEGILTSGFVRFVAIGNPTSKSTPFYKTFQNAGVKKFYLSCFRSPNLIKNGITDLKSLLYEINLVQSLPETDKLKRLSSYAVVQSSLLSTRWVVERAIEWGISHPLFVAKALGSFPDEDDHALFPLGAVEESMLRKCSGSEHVSIGVDVARYGTDKTVITYMKGNEVTNVKVLMKRDTSEVAGEIIAMVNQVEINKDNGVIIAVDATGIGSGVVDQLNDYKRHNITWRRVQILEVNFGEGFDKDLPHLIAEKKEKYVNRKAEIFVTLAADVKTELVLPDENTYLAELPTIIYRFNKKGQYVIESKDEYKRRTGRGSPDHADSLALANYARKQHNINSVLDFRDPKIKTLTGSMKATDKW